MVSHEGIPTHMILNPEPNLRPLTIASRPRNDEVHAATFPTLRHPHQETLHPSPPAPQLNPSTPRVTTHVSTTSVPVQSKQQSNNPEDPQPKKKQRWGDPSIHQPPTPPIFPRRPFQRSLLTDLTQETRMKRRSSQQPIQLKTSPQLPPIQLPSLLLCQLTHPPHQLPSPPIQNQFQKVLLLTLPFAFCNLPNRIVTLLVQLSDLGQIMKIRN